MVAPIVNPEIPYNGEIPDGLTPGELIRIQGVTHPDSDRFNINLQTGPEAKPRDDTALHISVRLNQGYIARNTYIDGAWGDEEGSGSLPIGQAQSFEIIVLVDPSHFKVAVNGQHFCEFSHRIPLEKVSHLLIDGQVSITLLSYEGGVDTISQAARSSELNAEGPQVPPQFGAGGYGPPPPGNYGPPLPGNYGPPQQGYGAPPYAGGYGPPPPLGAQQESGFNSFLSQAQEVLAGAISTGAAEKLLGSLLSGSGSSNQQQPQGYAHQNARYGVYPQLPTEENSNIQKNPHTQSVNQQQPVGPFESLFTNLLAGGKKTSENVDKQNPGQPQANQPQSGVIENILAGLLANNTSNQQPIVQQNQNEGGQQNAHQQSSGLQNFLAGLLTNTTSGSQQHFDQNNQPAQSLNQNQGIQGTGDQQNTHPQGGVLQNILAGLITNASGSQEHVDQNRPQAPGLNQNQGIQGAGDQQNTHPQSGVLQNILAGLITNAGGSQEHVDQNKPPALGLNQNQGIQGAGDQHNMNQSQSGVLQNLLGGLLSNAGGFNQEHDRNKPQSQSLNENQAQGAVDQQKSSQQQTNNLVNLLSGLLVSSTATRPLIENPNVNHPQPPQSHIVNPGAGGQEIPQIPPQAGIYPQLPTDNNMQQQQQSNSQTNDAQQQYGQYPHPQGQEQRGPMESLLSGLLSGGGSNQQHGYQQPHVPQVGGDGSVGGLGSMGSIFSSLAGQILQNPRGMPSAPPANIPIPSPPPSPLTPPPNPTAPLYPTLPPNNYNSLLNPSTLSYGPNDLPSSTYGLRYPPGTYPPTPSGNGACPNTPPYCRFPGNGIGTEYPYPTNLHAQHSTPYPNPNNYSYHSENAYRNVAPTEYHDNYENVRHEDYDNEEAKSSSKLKTALKYGLPMAGAGVGAYALAKALNSSSSSKSSASSSSSSSGSSEESD